MPKLFIIFLIGFISISFSVFCESPSKKLLIADSLFAQKKYTQSFELYEEIQKVDKKVSPAMLLKMAFIKEGLGDYTFALYYLNLYYLKTYNKRVLKKMENLADQNKLSGYNYDDVEFFLNIYHRYHIQIDLLILSIAIVIFAILFYQKRTKKEMSIFPQVIFISFLILIFILNNFGRESSKAIITGFDVHLMKGPSPGADVVHHVSKGHRVSIIGQDDVWVKILWEDDEVYIKSFNLKPIGL